MVSQEQYDCFTEWLHTNYRPTKKSKIKSHIRVIEPQSKPNRRYLYIVEPKQHNNVSNINKTNYCCVDYNKSDNSIEFAFWGHDRLSFIYEIESMNDPQVFGNIHNTISNWVKSACHG